MMETQTFFDCLSDPTRRRALTLLLTQGELCVCELMVALEQPQPKVSRHLSVLREAGLTTMRREGTWVYYRLHPELPLWAYRILEIMARDGTEAEAADDSQRLASMASRPIRCCA